MKITFFIPSLKNGGAERVIIELANHMSKNGHSISLVLATGGDGYKNEIESSVKIINLNSRKTFRSLFKFCNHIKENKPDGIISALSNANCIALLARKLTRTNIPIVVSERNISLKDRFKNLSLQQKLIHLSISLLYNESTSIIAVSKGVANSISRTYKIDSKKIKCIYNPCDMDNLNSLSIKNIEHKWFKYNTKNIILSVGRLNKQKNYDLLLKAFSIVRKNEDSKLIILGEGEERERLENLAIKLGLDETCLDMPGFVNNPYAFMKRSEVFVLSSDWEGLPNVVIQALALNCKIVSTDCDAGPREILDDGKLGILVEPGNELDLANAILKSLRRKSQNLLFDRKMSRFDIKNIALQYIQSLDIK
tara:strand:+ start:2748 stop:3845 length:1098 start_codon:yes stop_codon:yes gene_type:complete